MIEAHHQITDGTTYSTGYLYNLAGALTEQTYPSGRVVKNTFDENGDLAQVQSRKNANTGFYSYADAFSYNTAGAITKMQLGNGRWETFSYNSRQQITQIGLGTTDATTNLLKLEFGYGNSSQNNGSMLEQKITVPTVGSNPGFTAVQTYAYDSLNRIQSATETVSSSQTWKETFTIDRYGNRRYDAANTTTIGSCASSVCNPTINTSNNRVANGQGYLYDQNGNVTQDANNQRFNYDGENHQKEFFASSNPGGTPDWTYIYDGDGRRVKKASSTEVTIFVYDAAGKAVAEYSSSLAPVQQVSYLTGDHLGSPRITTDQNGTVTNRKDFTAYGTEAISAQRVPGTNGNRYETSSPTRKDYTGYEKDIESGLEFAQARYFNPSHGRFTSIDPLTASADTKNPQTFNRYSYVLNSPYKFVDPLGLIAESTECSFKCRVTNSLKNDTDLSEDDLALAKIHVENGTALGFQFQEMAEAAIARQVEASGAMAEGEPQTRDVPRRPRATGGNNRDRGYRGRGVPWSQGTGRAKPRKSQARTDPANSPGRDGGPVFSGLKDHARRHGDGMLASIYYNMARDHMHRHHWRGQARYGGENRTYYVSVSGSRYTGEYWLTSSSNSGRQIFTHMRVDYQYLQNRGITLPEGLRPVLPTFVGPIAEPPPIDD